LELKNPVHDHLEVLLWEERVDVSLIVEVGVLMVCFRGIRRCMKEVNVITGAIRDPRILSNVAPY